MSHKNQTYFAFTLRQKGLFSSPVLQVYPKDDQTQTSTGFFSDVFSHF